MMKLKYFAVAIGLSLGVSASSLGEISLEDPDISMGPGIGNEFASGTNLEGNVSGVFEDFELNNTTQLANGAASLAVVVTAQRNANDRIVVGDFLQCADLTGVCEDICFPEGDLQGRAGRINRTAIVEIALCLEDRLGAEIGAAFDKGPAVIKSFSAPDEDILGTGGVLRAYFSSAAELSAK